MITNARQAKTLIDRRGIDVTITDVGNTAKTDEPWKVVAGASQTVTVKGLLGSPSPALSSQGFKEPLAASVFISGLDAPAWLERGQQVDIGGRKYTLRGKLEWRLANDPGVIEIGLIN